VAELAGGRRRCRRLDGARASRRSPQLTEARVAVFNIVLLVIGAATMISSLFFFVSL
jgi:hypothetical protein